MKQVPGQMELFTLKLEDMDKKETVFSNRLNDWTISGILIAEDETKYSIKITSFDEGITTYDIGDEIYLLKAMYSPK